MIKAELCIICKGRLMCGLKNCPILEKYNSTIKFSRELKNSIFQGASPPGLFVSWKNYPHVSIAPMAPISETKEPQLLESPERWFGMKQEDIISMRTSLLLGSRKEYVHTAANPSYSITSIQELSMSEKSTTIEMKLKTLPKLKLEFSDSFAPLGPIGTLSNFRLVENPAIPRKVEYFYSDTSATFQCHIFQKFSRLEFLA